MPAWAVAILLFGLTLVAFWGVRGNDFVNYDDPDYVTQNVHVQSPWTSETVRWAFTESYASNWHPLTWFSHRLDVIWFGLKPAGHHLTSLILHALNAVLLFWFVLAVGKRLWGAALVAMLFAVHPLRVESVAWVAERKDVLSGFFFLLTLLAYVGYVRQRQTVGSSFKKGLLYGAALLGCALGLMSKPMLVTLPCVLLLLDFWPLVRIEAAASASKSTGKKSSPETWLSLVIEKIPFFALALAACLVTVWAQKKGGSVRTFDDVAMALRVKNSFVACLRYVGNLLWPAKLSVFYPYPAAWPGAIWLGALASLGGITYGCFHFRRSAPWWGVGWLWFLGMLVPVIGIVQVGGQSMADRYTYLPMIGLVWAAVWSGGRLWEQKAALRPVLMGGAVLVLGTLFILTRQQVARWKDSETLFRYALAVTKDNYTAEENLGISLAGSGRQEEALIHFEAGLRINPHVAEAHHNYGNTLMHFERVEEAQAQYRQALELRADYVDAWRNLGIACVKLGQMTNAAQAYGQAVALRPQDFAARYNYATALLEAQQPDAAAREYTVATEIAPDDGRPWLQLAKIAVYRGQTAEATRCYQRVLQLEPGQAEAMEFLQKGK